MLEVAATTLFSAVFMKHGALVIGLVIFIHGSRWLFTKQANLAAAEWLENIVPQVRLQPASDQKSVDANRERLEEQLSDIIKLAKHHLDVTVYFYTRYYMAITLFALLGGIAAIAVIFITRVGWESVHPYVITVFLVVSGHAAFYGAFPRIFQQEKNISDNKRLYTEYVALKNELKSYFVTGQGKDGTFKTESEFIHYVDGNLERLNNFAIGFDSTQVPTYKENFDKIK